MRDPHTGASRHHLPPRAGLSQPGTVRRALAPWFSIEHPPAAEWADYIVYGVVVAALALYLVQALPLASAFTALLVVLLGWLTWSGMEYGLHRHVLHHWPPFSRWHWRPR